MSSQRILSLCLGLAVLVLFGCSGNIVDPEGSTRRDKIGSLSHTLDRDEFGVSTPCYFPLHEGDRWVYLKTGDQLSPLVGSEAVVVRVTESHQMGEDQTVYHLDNYMFPLSGQPTQFYNQSPGEAFEVVQEETGLWYPWWKFSLPVETPILIPDLYTDCLHGSIGIYLGGPTTITVPAGTFERSVTIHYSSTPCADNGLVHEVFAPEVGLIERTTTSFVGEVTWSLVYAYVGGQEWGLPED